MISAALLTGLLDEIRACGRGEAFDDDVCLLMMDIE